MPIPLRTGISALRTGLAHDIGLVIAKAVHGQLAADVPLTDIVRQVALFGAQNRDGWGVGLTILTALGNLLPGLRRGDAVTLWRQHVRDGIATIRTEKTGVTITI